MFSMSPSDNIEITLASSSMLNTVSGHFAHIANSPHYRVISPTGNFVHTMESLRPHWSHFSQVRLDWLGQVDMWANWQCGRNDRKPLILTCQMELRLQNMHYINFWKLVKGQGQVGVRVSYFSLYDLGLFKKMVKCYIFTIMAFVYVSILRLHLVQLPTFGHREHLIASILI